MFEEFNKYEKPADSMAQKEEWKNNTRPNSDDYNKNMQKGADDWEEKKNTNPEEDKSDENQDNKAEKGNVLPENIDYKWEYQETRDKINKRIKYLSMKQSFLDNKRNVIKIDMVSWDDGNSVSLAITKLGRNWKVKETLYIDLKDFKPLTTNWDDQKQINLIPRISMMWDLKLLDTNLQNSNDIKNIVDSIDKNIIQSKREEEKAYDESKRKEKLQKMIDDFKDFICELNFDPKTDKKTIEYLSNLDLQNFNKTTQSFIQIIEALCRLRINSRHYSTQEIIDKLEWQTDEQPNTWEKTITSDESVIEYLFGASDEDLALLLKKEDELFEESLPMVLDDLA